MFYSIATNRNSDAHAGFEAIHESCKSNLNCLRCTPVERQLLGLTESGMHAGIDSLNLDLNRRPAPMRSLVPRRVTLHETGGRSEKTCAKGMRLFLKRRIAHSYKDKLMRPRRSLLVRPGEPPSEVRTTLLYRRHHTYRSVRCPLLRSYTALTTLRTVRTCRHFFVPCFAPVFTVAYRSRLPFSSCAARQEGWPGRSNGHRVSSGGSWGGHIGGARGSHARPDSEP